MTDSARDMAIGEMSGQLKMIIRDMETAVVSRREMHNEMKDQSQKLNTIGSSLDALSGRVAALEPGVKDYVTMRTKAEGAGFLGKALWLTGGFLIVAAAWLVSNLNWMIGRSN